MSTHITLSYFTPNNRKTKMQSNIYTNKIVKPSKPSKLDTSEKGVKTAHKGKSWKRGTDKRSMNFDSVQGDLK